MEETSLLVGRRQSRATDRIRDINRDGDDTTHINQTHITRRKTDKKKEDFKGHKDLNQRYIQLLLLLFLLYFFNYYNYLYACNSQV